MIDGLVLLSELNPRKGRTANIETVQVSKSMKKKRKKGIGKIFEKHRRNEGCVERCLEAPGRFQTFS
jgi:hypothetical protein